ncbi:MAG: GNAT family N-acetyltransferase, partial [Anaerolineales bacterium]
PAAGFFRGGLRMVLEKGRFKEIESWQKEVGEESSANFPDLTFLQLVFGYRDVDELEHAFPDLYYPKEEAKPLLRAMFPRKPSRVLDFG